MGNCNFNSRSSSCSCYHCEDELKNGCMRPTFCKPYGQQKTKVCPVCQAEYSLGYEKCPACSVIGKERE
ncbi:MAG: hypothetical protein LBD56_00545 [Endomicrobium sp.]|jgi:uncharacterized CHY-type Zn-finger protein|nr:hypothetical protein [Endomicrobium sp.]